MKKIIFTLSIVLGLASCSSDKTQRQVRYMAETDMYTPHSYEAYSESPLYSDGLTSRKAPAHTIARGYVPYELANTNAGYAKSYELVSPIALDKKTMKTGKHLYNIYCISCHGEKGDGMGELVKQEKYLGVPNYKDRKVNMGSIVHVITHGKGVMGSHASQLHHQERWQIAQYVMKLKEDL